jgi:uncharacterized protein
LRHLRSNLSELLEPGLLTFLDMLSEDAAMEFPYAPPGFTRRLDGKAAIRQHLDAIGNLIAIESFSSAKVYRTSTGCVLEFSCLGTARQTGRPYNQDYISVIAIRDGHIVHYRDYWNPLVVLEAVAPQAQTVEERTEEVQENA